MNGKNKKRDLREDWGRVQMLRSLLVAVFSKQIGYEGPINGWKRDALRHLVSAPWWAVVDSEEARRAYGSARKPPQKGQSGGGPAQERA